MLCHYSIAPSVNSTELGGIMSLFEVSLCWVLQHQPSWLSTSRNNLSPVTTTLRIGAILIFQSAPWKEVRVEAEQNTNGVHEKRQIDAQAAQDSCFRILTILYVPVRYKRLVC